MKIYIFTEIYPSPYKHYHDTQFEQFLEDGHQLKVFAFGCYDGEWKSFVSESTFNMNVVYLAATLKNVPKAVSTIIRRVLGLPFDTTRRLLGVLDYPASVKQRFMNCARAMQLPREQPDLCIIHNLITKRRLGFIRQVYPKSPIAFYYHGGELPGVAEVSDREAKVAFSETDIVFTNTESSRQHAIGRGCRPEKIFVCPVGFNLKDFPELRDRTYRRNGYLQVLTVGRLSEEKGVIYALDAFAHLRSNRQSIRCRIAGEGPQETKLRRYAEELGLGDTVEFIGKLSRERLFEEYSAADVLLLPSIVRGTWQENQACVVQEAMLARSIVAVSRTGGVPESIPPEVLQFSFEPENPGQIAASLSKLEKLSIAELKSLGNASRAFTEERYDICKLNRQLLDITCNISGHSG